MSTDRDLVRQVTRAVVARVGSAGPQVVEAVVAEVIASLTDGGAPAASPLASPAPRAVTNARGALLLPTVGETPSLATCVACVEQEKKRARSRAILTTTGKNGKGIVATITSRIAHVGGDILDISQTLVGDYFTMIIVIDVATLSVSFEQFQRDIQQTVADMPGCQAMMMHEDVMSSLHRV